MDASNREIRLRTVVRRLFTVNANQMESILQSGRSKENDLLLEVNYKKLKDQAEQLAIFDGKIKEAIVTCEDYEEENLEKEMTVAAEYQNKCLYLVTRYELMKNENQVEKTIERKNMRIFNLPKIEMRKFDGSVKNWLAFWGQFKKIDEDQNIDEDDKIQYLLQAMETNTDVYSLVQSYPPNGTSYRHCIEELKRRYARQELLIEVYVRELLALVLKEKRDMVELYDRLNAHLRALETLGVSKYAAFILPLVESALPLEILRIWERTKNSNQAAECTDGPETLLPRLMGFLKAEVESAQRIQITQSTFQKEKEEVKEPSVACFIAGEKLITNKSRLCIWCDKDNHSSVECYKLAKMTLEEREEHLKKKKACRICLKQGHYAKICKAFIRCHICSKRHTVAMCPGKTEPKKDRESQHQEQLRDKCLTNSTTTNISSQGIQTLLQTVMVIIRSGDKTLPVRALYDNGSQRSYIREEVILKLGIKNVGRQTLSHCLFGNVSTKSKLHKVYNINIESLDSKFKTEIEALSHTMICGHIPKANLNDNKLCNMLKRHNILLTDVVNSEYDIDLLIGADYAGLFMTSGIVNLENGLVAIKTKLGWTLQGRQNGCSSDNIVTSMFCVSGDSLTDFWSLETLGILDPAEMKTKAENEVEAIQMFERSIKREEDGRYLVQLPFKVMAQYVNSQYKNLTIAEMKKVKIALEEFLQNFATDLRETIENKNSDDVITTDEINEEPFAEIKRKIVIEFPEVTENTADRIIVKLRNNLYNTRNKLDDIIRESYRAQLENSQ